MGKLLRLCEKNEKVSSFIQLLLRISFKNVFSEMIGSLAMRAPGMIFDTNDSLNCKYVSDFSVMDDNKPNIFEISIESYIKKVIRLFGIQ